MVKGKKKKKDRKEYWLLKSQDRKHTHTHMLMPFLITVSKANHVALLNFIQKKTILLCSRRITRNIDIWNYNNDHLMASIILSILFFFLPTLTVSSTNSREGGKDQFYEHLVLAQLNHLKSLRASPLFAKNKCHSKISKHWVLWKLSFCDDYN